MKGKKIIKPLIVLFAAASLLATLTGCERDLPPEETQVIKITITPKPIVTLTPTPLPGEDPDGRSGSVTMKNDLTNTEETSGERSKDNTDEKNSSNDLTPTPTPADQEDSEEKLPEGVKGTYYGRDIYGNYITYDEYGLYVYDVNGNLVTNNSDTGNSQTDNYSTNNYSTNNYGTNNYSSYGYDYGGYSYGYGY